MRNGRSEFVELRTRHPSYGFTGRGLGHERLPDAAGLKLIHPSTGALAGQSPVCVPRGMLEMDEVTTIRRLVLVKQQSQREVAKKG